jgi:epoxyqueuosine reductase
VSSLKSFLASESARLGFTRMRIASAAPPLDMARYDAFLAEDRHGEMGWLATGRDERADPSRLLPNVRSVAVFAFDYGSALPPDPGGLTGRVASYAWGRDYHNLVLKRLRNLQRRLNAEFPRLSHYASLDARPVFERAWADRAGLGWAAKNACQVIPGEGSYFFLATLLLSVELPPDPPLDDHCGRCQRCLDACPTAAFVAPGALDATRCISYLTIESDLPFPEALRPKVGRWLFGCDDCQESCPHTRFGKPPHTDLLPRHAWIDLPSVLLANDTQLEVRFTGTPLRRAAGPRLRRNAAIVLGNLGDRAAIGVLDRVRGEAGIVGEAARWALERLS